MIRPPSLGDLNRGSAVRLNGPHRRDGRDVPESGRIMLTLSFVELDPEQKSEIKIVRISDTHTSLESGVRSSNLFGRATTPFIPLEGSHP